MNHSHDSSKRKFIKAAGYAAPAILTLKAVPAFAGIGSGANGNNGRGNGTDPQPPSPLFTPPNIRPND